MKGDRYTVVLVAKLLENYAELEIGKLPGSGAQTGYVDWGTVISRSRLNRAPFELTSILQADIDCAIRHLRVTSKFVITNHSISGRTYEWCGFLLELDSTDVIRIELAAIERMTMFLNGEE